MGTTYLVLNKKIALAIFCIGVTAFAALNCLQPIIPAIGQGLGLAPAAASTISSAGMLGVAFMLFALTFLAERLSRKKYIAIALGISSGGTALLGLLPDFSLMLALRFVTGMSIAFIPTLIMAYIQEEFSSAETASISGLYISGTTIGGLIGRLLTSYFTDSYSWQTSIVICGTVLVATALIATCLLPEERSRRQQAHSFSWSFFSWKNKSLFLLCLLAFCIMGCFVSVFNYIPYVLMSDQYKLPQKAIGLIFLVQLFGFISSSLCGRLVKILGTVKLIAWQLLIMLAGAALTLLQPLSIKLIGLAAVNFGFFGAHACAISWCGNLCPSQKAASVALYMLCYYAGASVLGSGAGIFYQQSGWNGVISAVITALLLAALALGGICYLRQELQDEQGNLQHI